MAKKVTFSLDEETLARLAATAERLRKPKSEVVREAIADYHDRAGRLSEAERRRLLGVLDQRLPALRPRPAKAVAGEIEAIRSARRAGGRGAR
ncbi:MAG: ribbon-helix-helix protein, CopG family [Acidobacteria bacterium]|nr:ribbon-helix-helix protein, CopG family [Acidobacteriota bacterium]